MNFIIILFGAPGCGKGHLWSVLQEKLLKLFNPRDVGYISTGNLIRDEIARKSELGLQIAKLVQSGFLISDNIVDSLIANALKAKQTIKVLDGYPRTNSQFDYFVSQIDEDTEVIAVFRDTPEDIILSRIAKRRVCKDCKHTHTSDNACCPKCGGESIVREDDVVITSRIEEFKKHTLPIWNRMSEIGITLHFVCDESSEAITKVITSLLIE